MAKVIEQKEIHLNEMYVDQANVRQSMTDLGELENSIEHHGVIEPIVVRRDKEGRYGVVVGGRRFAAAKAVGLSMIPAIVKDLTDEEAFIESAVENLQRENLSPEDQLAVVKMALDLFGSQKAVAEVLDKSVTWIRDHLEIQRFRTSMSEGGAPHAAGEFEIPRDYAKAAEIVRTAKDLYPSAPEKQADLFEQLRDRPRDQVRRFRSRVLTLAEEDPLITEKPASAVVKDVLQPKRIEVVVEFSSKISRGLVKAARDRDVSEEDIVEIAVEQWLGQEGYVD